MFRGLLASKTRTALAVLALAVGVVLLAIGLRYVLMEWRPVRDGPDAPLTGGSETTTGARVPAGGSVTFGNADIVNQTDHEITVHRVDPLEPTGVEILQLAGSREGIQVGLVHGWPPPDYTEDDLLDVRGLLLAPHTSLQLVTGARLAAGATFGRIEGFRVYYELRGKRYRIDIRHGLELEATSNG